jgi:hypothetical protein
MIAMDSDETRDAELVARLRRLDAGAGAPAPAFDYDGMLTRHAQGMASARRRAVLTRVAAVGLVVALVGASAWRLEQHRADPAETMAKAVPAPQPAPQPRIVRADTYFAVAALEDHIASVDDLLNVARLRGGTEDVARLERTRAELIASYQQVRYAEMVSANF